MRFAPRGEGSNGVMRYIVEKGFVCVDGASLTVTKVGGTEGGEGEGWFEVMLVAYTQEKIVTAMKLVGGTVNVEVDLMGKLVEVSLSLMPVTGASEACRFLGLYGLTPYGDL